MVNKDNTIKPRMSFDVNIGFYPGIVIGIRTYHDVGFTTHAFYLPLVSLHIVVENDFEE